jgi:hypothetical protein
MPTDAATFSADAEHCIAMWRNVLIQIWRTATSEVGARNARAAGAKLLAATQGPLGCIVVVERDAAMPSPAARAQLSALVADVAARTRGIALVQEGDGFRAATVRAVMTGLMLVARNAVPHKIFRTVDEGEAWLRSLMDGHAGAPGELAQTVAGLRDRMPARRRAG